MSDDIIGAFLVNKEAIIQAIANDPLLSLNDAIAGDEQTSSLADIIHADGQLTAELHELNSLKTVPSLIMEFKANWDYLELENCYYSLKNLRKKLRDNELLIKQNIMLKQSLATYVDSMHVQYIEKLYDLITTCFWEIDEISITFKNSVTYSPDKVEFQYLELMEFIMREFFPEGILDSEIWFIKDIVMGDLQETCRNKLSSLLQDYIHCNCTINNIKNILFEANGFFKYTSETHTLSLGLTSNDNNSTAQAIDKIDSFSQLIDFLDFIIPHGNFTVLANSLGSLIATELLKFVKSYISLILQESEDILKVKCTEVNKKLTKLSESTISSWNYTGNDIHNFLTDERILNNMIIDRIYEEHFEKLRDIFNDKSESWRTIMTAELEKKTISNREIPTSPSKMSTKSSHQDEWSWDGEDDAWDEQTDIQDVSEKEPEKVEDKFSEHGDEDWDDGWDVHVDIDDIAVEEKQTDIKPDIASPHNPKLNITQLPNLLKEIFDGYKESCRNTFENKSDPQYRDYKFNLLQSSAIAMGSRHLQENWWQFYIDMRYITIMNASLDRLNELIYRLLENRLALEEKHLFEAISEQLSILKSEESNSNWSSHIKMLHSLINKRIIMPLEKIGQPELDRFGLRFLHFLYNTCIVDPILKWKIISEKNSENLSELITLIASSTEIPSLKASSKYREIREKFIMVGNLLPLHLKEIMQLFYDGDFFLFSTEEIVQWIMLLFADTPLRRNAIEDIYEIRGTTLDEYM